MRMRKHEVNDTIYNIIGRLKSNGEWIHLAPEYITVIEKIYFFKKKYIRHHPSPITTKEQAQDIAISYWDSGKYQDIQITITVRTDKKNKPWPFVIWENGKWV